jgi:hypothetical protein
MRWSTNHSSFPALETKVFFQHFLDRDDARASLTIPLHKGYGLCVLDIERMRAETANQAGIEFAPTRNPFGASHVKILGCTIEEVREILALIAEVDVHPEKPG